MPTQSLFRWGAITTIVTALIFVTAAVAVIIVPDGGLANLVSPLLYYFGLIFVVPTYVTIYAAQTALNQNRKMPRMISGHLLLWSSHF